MSDADRLRQAADTQDDWGEGAAIAALLRAVDEMHTAYKSQPPTSSDVGKTSANVVVAALALADVILGGQDE